MSKARLIITAVVDEHRTKSEVARDYDVSRYWVQQLVKRWYAEGEGAHQPHSRRPRSSPHAVAAEVEEEIVRLRKELSRQGLDAGADTIRSHLARRTPRSQTSSAPAPPAVSTIWRILTRRGFVTPQPQKRPRSSWRTFGAEQPNERWQADTTHWQLADGTPVEILNLLDDHSRLALASVPGARSPDPTSSTPSTKPSCAGESRPACSLTTVRSSPGCPAAAAGSPSRSSSAASGSGSTTPAPPQTCGKVERFQQTEKKWLAAQPPARTVAGLQRQLTRFRRYYNQVRPHRALDRRTPWEAYTARPKATATGPYIDPHWRVRHDRVDRAGTVTLRHNSRLHHIGVGRLHAGTPITLLIDDLHIRIIDRHTGELLRELTLDPTRDFQPRGVPPGPAKKQP